jgi:uncharacterized phage protein (predicted DNA packaging)
MDLLYEIKIVLRIVDDAYDEEIRGLIDAARQDLYLSGISQNKTHDNNDPLVRRAIITYVKAHFGWNNPDAQRLSDAYSMIKTHLALSSEYRGD